MISLYKSSIQSERSHEIITEKQSNAYTDIVQCQYIQTMNVATLIWKVNSIQKTIKFHKKEWLTKV